MAKVKNRPGYISVTNKDKDNYFKEEFKGTVFDKEVTFPRGIGAKHPFEFEDVERVYIKYGVIAGAVNKVTDSIVTDFQIKLDNVNAQKIIDSFIEDTNFHIVIREWVREGLLKGNGFIEIDLDKLKIRVMNSNQMYVKRNRVGKVLGYNQWTKNSFKNFSKDSKNLITFTPKQIAHLQINKIPNDPYGIGMVWPNERIIQNLVKNEQDLQVIVERKANSPYHFKVGQPGTNVPSSVIDGVKGSLQYLTNTHEWVTDGEIEIKSIDFPSLGTSLTQAQEYFFRMLVAGLEVPEVMMGSGQLNEGIAKTQLKVFERKVNSIQNQVASVIEEKIIRPLLRANNLDEKPKFLWNLPDAESINDRIEKIRDLLNVFGKEGSSVSANLRRALEIELAKLLEFDDLANILPKPEKGLEDKLKKEKEEAAAKLAGLVPEPEVKPGEKGKDAERENEEKNIPQPEVPGVKPGTSASSKINIKEHEHKHEEDNTDIPINEWISADLIIKEIPGFNYTDYLIKILEVTKADGFVNLLAVTEQDLAAGLLTQTQVDKLRVILKDGFKQNMSIREIERNIKKNVGLTDRIKKKGIILAANRPINIARTETVRLANIGLLNMYRENKIQKVRFLAVLSARTCPICESLNGTIYSIEDSDGIIPVHAMCRCTWVSITE